ncbi:cytochrome b-245 chaperone 1 homolog [Corticium candelabrum]|uniref:cytochrome b-245 chaperone 1 homolog n=1 Tax=Corticium candelabrum TaxID=121492 RepID=UPI002E2F61AD|nr:cytochrome b-245 chaperone 1 homolog [Corticium candelabrum]
MAYMTVVERSAVRFHLTRSPSYRSWLVLVGLTAFGNYVAATSTDSSFVWRLLCAAAGFGLGYVCMDKWEECILDKAEGKVSLNEQSLVDRFILNHRKTIVSQLDEIIGVTVAKEIVRYAGTGYQVVLQFDSGYSLAITSCCSYARSPCEHEEMARQISIFLDLEKNINGADAKGDKQD